MIQSYHGRRRHHDASSGRATEAILGDPPFLINLVLWGLAVVGIGYWWAGAR